MAKLAVTVFCTACYNSCIDVPDSYDLEKAIEYAKEHLDDIPLGVLEYVPDSDELDAENCSLENRKEVFIDV